MNYLDIFIVFFIIASIYKGKTLGLMLSIFNFLQLVLSVLITKAYYNDVFFIIKDSQILSGFFNKLSYLLLRLIFFKKDDYNSEFFTSILSVDVFDFLLIVYSGLIVYILSNIIIDIIFSLFSFLLEIRLLKVLDQFGGLILGFLKGLLLVTVLSFFLGPVFEFFPEWAISKLFFESRILDLLYSDFNILKGGLI